jgi:sporulation protein YlmC with PRC-barrel domain
VPGSKERPYLKGVDKGKGRVMEIAIDRIVGRKVLDITGRVLGSVGHLLVDTESWAISAFQLRLRRKAAREMGVRWSFFRVPTLEVPTGLVMAASDAIILRAELADLQPLAPPDQPYAEPAIAH